MSLIGQTFRAYRPSYYCQPEDFQLQEEPDRQAKISTYLKRAEEGLPLFEAEQQFIPVRRTTVA